MDLKTEPDPAIQARWRLKGQWHLWVSLSILHDLISQDYRCCSSLGIISFSSHILGTLSWADLMDSDLIKVGYFKQMSMSSGGNFKDFTSTEQLTKENARELTKKDWFNRCHKDTACKTRHIANQMLVEQSANFQRVWSLTLQSSKRVDKRCMNG